MSPIPVPMRSGAHDPLRRRGHEARARMDVHGLVRDCAKVPAPPARTLAGAARAAAPSRAGRERWKGRALAHAGCFSLRMHSDGSRLLRATWSTSPAVMICAVVPRVCRVCAACVPRAYGAWRACARAGWGGVEVKAGWRWACTAPRDACGRSTQSAVSSEGPCLAYHILLPRARRRARDLRQLGLLRARLCAAERRIPPAPEPAARTQVKRCRHGSERAS